jgi:arginyl-tRNA synthetase
MSKIKNQIEENLKNIVRGLTDQDVEVEVQIPDRIENGDFFSNIALQAFKVIREKDSDGGSHGIRNIPARAKSPHEMAEKIKVAYDALKDLNIERVEVAGPGFINFFVSKSALADNLKLVLNEKGEFGKSQNNKRKKAVVEFSSPNIAKPFTVGHLRSTIIGDAVANLLEASGWEVFRDNHLGDWGTQFGKQIYAIKSWGDEEKIEKSENPVKELVALYVKFHEEAEKNPDLDEEGRAWFKKLEDGDTEARRLWQKCIGWSMKEFEKLYKLLGISFSENNGQGYGESYFEDNMEHVIAELREKGLLKNQEVSDIL